MSVDPAFPSERPSDPLLSDQQMNPTALGIRDLGSGLQLHALPVLDQTADAADAF